MISGGRTHRSQHKRKVSASTRHIASILTIFACGLAAMLTIGAGTAFSERVSKAEEVEAAAHNEHFRYNPRGIEGFTRECSGSPEVCHESDWLLPPGEYLGYESEVEPVRVHEFSEQHCENAEKDEGCTVINHERPEKSADYIPPGYRELFQVRFNSKNVNWYFNPVHESLLIEIYAWKPVEKESERFGLKSEAEPDRKPCSLGFPVNCATGNQVVTETDSAIGGRGPTLGLTRTYNSLLAAKQTTAGPFGYGWTGSYSAHLELSYEGREATVYQDNGSTVTFDREKEGEAWTAPSSLVEATLVNVSGGYVYTLPNQTKLNFNTAGVLTSEEDRNGNAITLSYNADKQLETVTDATGRKLTFKYNGSGQIESIKDPMGHTVKYTYESGNLTSITQPSEEKTRWKLQYNSAHELTSETDGREHTVVTEYNEAHQVSSQKDAMSRKRTWEYTTAPENSTKTTITEPNGSTTVDEFNEDGLPTNVTHASGTSIAATTTHEYNSAGQLVAVTDPNKHKTEYGYDAAGNKTSEKDADGDETKWKYDGTHDIETETTPGGETTTTKRNSHGDPEVIERPAPSAKTQKTAFKYASNGDVESMTDPLEHTWKYEYDAYGDRKAETDPEGNKRTWEYNEDSQETATVSPRGNVAGGKPTEFTTKIEVSAKGQPLKITDPLGHTTKYTYDGNGNLETLTDGNSNKTTYAYDTDNERTKTEEPTKAVTETEYDSMGEVKSQTDGNKHTTKYERNALEEVTEEVNPIGRKTKKEYDGAGNLKTVEDPEKHTTTYTYDPANHLTEVSYSTGSPAAVKYEYNKDGYRTKMTDGTGTTKYEHDQLDRLTETENGHKETAKYEYNLANGQSKITYPNGKAVTREYDKDERLEKVTDWNAKSTKFAYNHDSELEKTVFPTENKRRRHLRLQQR